jgi:hypothetical protein
MSNMVGLLGHGFSQTSKLHAKGMAARPHRSAGHKKTRLETIPGGFLTELPADQRN